MKERKYLRLLSFRAQGERRPDRGREIFDAHADEELNELLRLWEAPGARDGSDARLLAAYRQQVAPRVPLWKRLLTFSIPVPAPVAGLALIAFALVASALAARPHAITLEVPSSMLTSQTATKIVEVPVPQERVVTRIVYVEKKTRQASDEATNSQQSQQRQQLAASHERTSPSRAASAAARDRDEHGTGYFTRVDMEDFQPAEEMKIRIIAKKGHGDEN